jgi:PBSX family phage portal protein
MVTESSPLRERADSSNSVNKSAAHNLVRARIIEVRKGEGSVKEQIQKQLAGLRDEPGMSQVVPEDPLMSLAAEGKLLEPPFDMLTLALLPEQSSEMGQVIEAMETNIEGFGHRFIPRLTTKANDSLRSSASDERVKLTNFFAYASMDMSFTELRRRRRKDLETTGNAYWEIIRSANNAIQGFSHIPSYQVRISVVDEEPIKVEQPILELQTDGSVKIESITRWRRFRIFAQSRTVFRRGSNSTSGTRVRWFKEFGDPRQYNNRTGDVLTDEEAAKTPKDHLANELEHFKIYSARSPYGLPRYIGNLLSIFGARAAEEINYSTFKNNNIPSMVVSVSNGMLTEGSVTRIEEFVESQINASSNWSKFLILEAEGLVEGEDGNQIKIDIKPLTKEQHTDSLFQNYDKNSSDKIRRSWRLPPIFVGATDDYTRTTAETSRRLADEQVFAPERDDFDDWMNLKMFPYMDIMFNKFKSNSPNTTDNAELVKILAGAEKTGGMNPRIARDMLEDILGKELPDFPDNFDADLPFSLAMAEAVKNNADPTEPGQQVTALKAVFVDSEPEDESSTEDEEHD